MERVRFGWSSSVLAVLLLFGFGPAQAQKKSQLPEEFKHFETRPCFPEYGKGGVGIVNEQVFVLTKSPNNEAILHPKNGREEKWRGQNMSQEEVVFVFDDRVWEVKALPQNFNLSKSVIISFEGEKIRIFDFQKESGCYYLHKSSD